MESEESILCQINYTCPSPSPGHPPCRTRPRSGMYCISSTKQQRSHWIYCWSMAIYKKPTRHNWEQSRQWGKGEMSERLAIKMEMRRRRYEGSHWTRQAGFSRGHNCAATDSFLRFLLPQESSFSMALDE